MNTMDKELKKIAEKISDLINNNTVSKCINHIQAGDTTEDWKNILKVIVVNRGIIMEDWKGSWEELLVDLDSCGITAPFRIDDRIYEHFLGSVPPVEMGGRKKRILNLPYGLGYRIESYFLEGEPYRIGEYGTFGIDMVGKCWYLGKFNLK